VIPPDHLDAQIALRKLDQAGSVCARTFTCKKIRHWSRSLRFP
jgi:hypothetical protein